MEIIHSVWAACSRASPPPSHEVPLHVQPEPLAELLSLWLLGPRAVIATSPGTDIAGLGSACLLLLLSVNPTAPVVLHLLQSLSIEQVLVLQVGLLVGFWELCTGADLKERESVIAWEMVEEQGLSRASGKGKAVSPGSTRVLVPGALLGLVAVSQS